MTTALSVPKERDRLGELKMAETDLLCLAGG